MLFRSSKANKLYKKAKAAARLNTITKDNCLEYGIVEGNVKSIEGKSLFMNKLLMKYKYEAQLSLPFIEWEERPLRSSYLAFDIIEKNGNRIRIFPDEATKILNANNKRQNRYDYLKIFFRTFLSLKFTPGTIQYFVFDNDRISILGLLKYNPSHNMFTIDADYITSDSLGDLLEYLINKQSLWKPITLGIVCGLFAVITIRKINIWLKSRRER